MSKFIKWLDHAQLKKTKHRLLILKLLDQAADFVSAEDLFLQAKEHDAKLSLSTVYRILDSFVKASIVSPLNIENAKQVYYEIAHSEHAHHLICLECSKVVHIKGCPLDSFEKQVEANHGFSIQSHTLDFYGLCEKCKSQNLKSNHS